MILDLTEPQISLILAALSELPLKTALPVVASIQVQVQEQKEKQDASRNE